MDRILETVHAVQSPNRTRAPGTSLSVICAGLPRTGTASLAKALTTLGYGEVYHGSFLTSHPGDCKSLAEAARLKQTGNSSALDAHFFERLLGTFGAISDMPAASYIEELIQAYPHAKVVLNERDVDAWFHSMQIALGMYLAGRKYYELFDTKAFWMRRYIETNSDPFYNGDFVGNAKEAYVRHVEKVRNLVPKERLLEWRVEDGWEPLCKFLGCPVPKTSFPSANATGDILPRLHARIQALKGKADRRIGIAILILSVSIAAVSYACYGR